MHAHHHRQATLARAALGLCCLLMTLAACTREPSISLSEETAQINDWRARRVASLTSENGWLTLVGLYWLQSGRNEFGRAASNALSLDHRALPDHAGVFEVDAHQVRFVASGQVEVQHDGQPVTSISLISDAQASPTVLSIGSLRLHVIERVGKLGVRIRDVEHPARRQFAGLEYFSIDPSWHVSARWLPYEPVKMVPIVNILGMTEPLPAPGAIEVRRGDQVLRLDAILEAPDDQELMVMFNDSTNGRTSYGAGRYLTIARPAANQPHVDVDFNKAYNPPCAFTEFATCPLPPRQNRLALAIEAGEQYRAPVSHRGATAP